MTDNRVMLDNLEFERQIKDMTDRSLMEFTARQVYVVVLTITNHEKRITTLESRDRKFFGAIGGIGGAIGAGIVAAINYFFQR